MAAKPAIETYYEGYSWKNREQGAYLTLSTHTFKDDAVAQGRRYAIERQTEHIIKGMDGTILERNSYGNDPHPPKG